MCRESKADEVVDDIDLDFCSFSEGTQVATEDGYTAISDVEVGDYVLAYDEATGEIGYYPVTAVWAHEDPVIVYLTINGETIETTPEHPFYATDGEWVPAGELQAGSEVRRADGGYSVVENVAFVYQLQPMYNLTVAKAHTYFVGDGQWLVHNTCTKISKDISPGQITEFWQKRLAQSDAAGSWGSSWDMFAMSNNVIGYEVDDTLVGALAFTRRQSDNLPQSALYVMALEVLEEHRGAGVARALMQEAQSESIQQGLGGNLWAVVNKSQPNWQDNVAAMRRLGFEAISEGESITLFF